MSDSNCGFPDGVIHQHSEVCYLAGVREGELVKNVPDAPLKAEYAEIVCRHGRPDNVRCSICSGDDGDWWPGVVDAQIHTDIAILDAIKALRAQAAAERVAMHERGEPLTDYSAGVLAGLDRAWLTGFRAARKPDDTRETTSPEEWWACERAFLAGREDALATPPASEGQPVQGCMVCATYRGEGRACPDHL